MNGVLTGETVWKMSTIPVCVAGVELWVRVFTISELIKRFELVFF